MPSSSDASTAPPLRRVVLLVLIAMPAASAAVRIARGGLAALLYDECEYVRFMLTTADEVFRRGLLAWPDVVARHQAYVKPPLLVDLGAAFVLLLGRAQPVWSMAAVMAGTALATGWVVLRLACELFSWRTAVVALLVLGAIPAWGLYTAEVFPEPLVALLLFTVIALLFSCARRPLPRTLALGAALGAGLLAKLTFAGLAVGPLAVAAWWAWRSEPGGREPAPLGWGRLAAAVAIALAVAALWYAQNLPVAVDYARDAYDFATWTPRSAGEIAAAWVAVVAREAFGLAATAAVVTCAVAALMALRRGGSWSGGGPWSGWSGRQCAAVLALLAAALPTLLAALPSPNVSSRLLLPGFAALAVAAGIALADLRTAGLWRVVRAAVLVLIGLQWTLVQIGGFSSGGAHAYGERFARVSRWLAPYFGPLDRYDTRPLERLLQATAHLDRGPAVVPVTTFYFVDNHPELDVARFALYETVRESRSPSRWLCYFDWSPAEARAALEEARRGPSLVVSYRPDHELRPDLAFLNRRSADCLRWVRDPSNGFRPVGDLAPAGAGYALELYANFAMTPPERLLRRAAAAPGEPASAR